MNPPAFVLSIPLLSLVVGSVYAKKSLLNAVMLSVYFDDLPPVLFKIRMIKQIKEVGHAVVCIDIAYGCDCMAGITVIGREIVDILIGIFQDCRMIQGD